MARLVIIPITDAELEHAFDNAGMDAGAIYPIVARLEARIRADAEDIKRLNGLCALESKIVAGWKGRHDLLCEVLKMAEEALSREVLADAHAEDWPLCVAALAKIRGMVSDPLRWRTI